jgi:hypothetical protein
MGVNTYRYVLSLLMSYISKGDELMRYERRLIAKLMRRCMENVVFNSNAYRSQ